MLSQIRASTVLIASLALAATAAGQGRTAKPKAAPPLLSSVRIVDTGVPVEMFESPNVDRFLRKAQDFLNREEYGNAIKVLQDVIEGRTTEFSAAAEEPAAADNPAGKPPGQESIQLLEDNAGNSVFSEDQRLYRPVSRLCHELLAELPAAGIGIYRNRYGYMAEQAYKQAYAVNDLAGLQAVYQDYFVSLHAGMAMLAAGDLLMDLGRFRSALQTFETLLNLYPEPNRREAGMHDLMILLKLAICYQQLHEPELAEQVLQQIAELWPEDSVRLQGELCPVRDLPASSYFSSSLQSEGLQPGQVEDPGSLQIQPQLSLGLGQAQLQLLPLWEQRYTNPEPYSSGKASSRNRNAMLFAGRGGGVNLGVLFPSAKETYAGTSVQMLEGKAVFMDHYCLRVHDIASGLLLNVGNEQQASFKAPPPNAPRARVPAYDLFGLRVAVDDNHWYVIEGSIAKSRDSVPALLRNKLIAMDRETGATTWKQPGPGGARKRNKKYGDATYLASPAVDSGKLYLPTLDQGIFCLLCLDALSGEKIFNLPLHSKGTNFIRSPAAPVTVQGGVAYVLTNAGVVSAVDANLGNLLWSRKYERDHPVRGPKKAPPVRRGNRQRFYRQQSRADKFRGFAPQEICAAEGLLVIAPVDGTALLCLDGASGKLVWALSQKPATRNSKIADVVGAMQYIIGHDATYLYIACDRQVLCVEIRSGRRMWVRPTPNNNQIHGRGTLVDGFIVLHENSRQPQLNLLPLSGNGPWQELRLPAFSISGPPLLGPGNVFVRDANLGICYEGGVQIVTSNIALQAIANSSNDLEEKANVLAHLGRLPEAVRLLGEKLQQTTLENDRARILPGFLSMMAEATMDMAKQNLRTEALQLLDDCRPVISSPAFVRRWHLARLDVWRVLGDQENMELERDILESWRTE